MEAIRYITDKKGKYEGLLIDLNSLRKKIKNEEVLVDLMEDIEDMVAIELNRNEKSRPYEEARKDIFGKGK